MDQTCIGYLGHPFRKKTCSARLSELTCHRRTGFLAHQLVKRPTSPPDLSFCLAPNSMEGQKEPVHLAGWREEVAIKQEQRRLSGSIRSRK